MTAVTTSILVGTDFSDSSDRALAHALQLAERLGARLDLVHVVQIQAPAVLELWLAAAGNESQITQTKQMLKAVRDRVSTEKTPCRTHLRLGDPVAGMLELIESLKPSLVVVGSHGRGAMMRALLGSVSERLCRRSPVPVLVVPAPGRAAAAREEAAADAASLLPVVETAWSCHRCGHIRMAMEPQCDGCGMEPAAWDSAPISRSLADEAAPTVGASTDEHVASASANDPAVLFSISPPGTEGYSINPELRIRY
jgi:nucleotide-binding universal stress UspA family protein